jgi:fimbrial chaperone protein
MISRFLAAVAAVALLMPVAADAATVVIWPVDPVLSGTQQATALWLENKGQAPVTLQVRSLTWSQADGADVTADQDEVIASPPIATVGPGQRQLVRIIRRQPAVVAQERSYRLFVDELPSPPGSGGAGASAQLSVKMRYSIPLFVQPAPVAPAPRLSARVTVRGAERVIEIANSGSGRARLTELRVGSGQHQRVVQPGLVGYVLPGATMAWPLPAGESASGLTVAVNGTDQPLLPTS